MPNIEDRYEAERGCGYRVPGGRYLIGGNALMACDFLPVPLTVCPTCSGGIKFSRGWTWVNGNELVKPKPHGAEGHSAVCYFGGKYDLSKVGLLWVGERSYSPADFLKEARDMGISRRIGYLPRGLKMGETIILLAHKKVQCDRPVADDPERIESGEFPAIFSAFIPYSLEYVVKGDESEETLDNLTKKGYNLVRVHRKGEEESDDSN